MIRTEAQRLKYNAYMRKWNSQNREKVRARNKQYKLDKPDNYRNSKLKTLFGITLEEYKQLYEAQKGRCAICDQPEITKHQNGKVKALAVDHCHSSQKVRGLLCSKCNIALGLLEDDITRAEKLLQYLKER